MMLWSVGELLLCYFWYFQVVCFLTFIYIFRVTPQTMSGDKNTQQLGHQRNYLT